LSRGRSSETFLRLCVRAPRMRMESMDREMEKPNERGGEPRELGTIWSRSAALQSVQYPLPAPKLHRGPVLVRLAPRRTRLLHCMNALEWCAAGAPGRIADRAPDSGALPSPMLRP